MQQPSRPKIFVSHATEDKERFVNGFATKLIENGIDAWVDKWEIKLGDSLVDRIFEEGIKNAQAIIIVLSSFSVNKRWVREELNASIVQKINKQTRIIPIVIDDCEIPVSLQPTLQERVSDLNNIDSCVKKIVSTIFEISEKPEFGSPPRHVKLQIDKIPGLSIMDTKILKLAGDLALSESSNWIQPTSFRTALDNNDISKEEAADSVEILSDRGLVESQWSAGLTIPFFKITDHGFENYGKFFIPDFDSLFGKVMLAILNNDLTTAGGIADHLSQSPIMIEFLLDILKSRKMINMFKSMGDIRTAVVVHGVTTQGRRFASQLQG